MTRDYYADVYLRGCGELTVKRELTVVDEDAVPGMVKITVYAYKPEDGEDESAP